MLPPDGNWRPAQAAVDRLVVGADYVEGDVALELAQGERRMPLRIVFAEFLRVAERRAGQQVQLPHLRADQTLDMTAEARLRRRSPLNRDACILAPSLESTAPKVGAVVDVKCFRQAGGGPRFGDLAFSQLSRLVEDRVQQAQTCRQPGRRVHRQVESRHHAAADIHRQRQPGPADRLAGFLVNDKDIRFRMIDLNDLQRPGGGKYPGNGLCLLHDLIFATAVGAFLQIDVFETSLDRSAMRRLEPGRHAVRLDIPDQL